MFDDFYVSVYFQKLPGLNPYESHPLWPRQLNPNPGYYCTGRSVKILRAVVRLGKDDTGQAIVFMSYFLLLLHVVCLFVCLFV